MPSTSPSTPTTRLPPRAREETDSSTADEVTPQRDSAASLTEATTEYPQPAPMTVSRPSSITATGMTHSSENTGATTTITSDAPLDAQSEVAGIIETNFGHISSLGNSRVNENTTSVVTTGASDEGTETPHLNTSSLPYTTFQQLEYLPQIPPSVLASSYIIPPTYETVLSASPNPESSNGMFRSQMTSASSSMSNISSLDRVAGCPHIPKHAPLEDNCSTTPSIGHSSHLTSPPMLLNPDWGSPNSTQDQKSQPHTSPLLSPVSLLANPSARNNGPPGLFFVSKGRNSTAIVVSNYRCA